MLILIAIPCSFLIALSVYRFQVKNNYKKPMMTAGIVFILVLGLLTATILLLFDYMFRW